MALLYRAGLFFFRIWKIIMSAIDIVTFRGETPKVAPHLLANEVATLASDCQYERGTLGPLNDDDTLSVALPFTPKSLFHYRDDFWFAARVRTHYMRSPVAQDSYGRVYFTDGTYPKVTNAAIATSGSSGYPSNWYRLGVPAPDAVIRIDSIVPPSGDNTDSEEDATDDETRYYVSTWVTGSGEEGPPSEASAAVELPIYGSSVVLTLQPPGTNNNDIQRRRIYRSVTSDTSADYLLVAEIPAAQGSYTDSVKTPSAALATYDYLPPPSDMQGICLMANGIAAGFAGNSILFSEAYLPYAWPKANRLTTEHDIIAIAAIGTALVVGTKGHPYVASGVSPSSMTSTKIDLQQACVSADSMVAMDGLVLYAGPDGLCGIASDGGRLITDQIITRSQWQAMKPETMRAWYHEGEYVAITDVTAFIYNPKTGDLRNMSNRWDAAYHDMLDDTLYVAKGTALHGWKRADSITQPYLWRSKEFVLPHGSLTCARVQHGPGSLTFRIILDGVKVMELDAPSQNAFRLPPLRGNKWQVEVSGTAEVERIQIATSMAEID